MKSNMCTLNVELLTVILKPFYLPTEFTHVIVTCVYAPPNGNAKEAANTTRNQIHDLQTSYPDAMKIYGTLRSFLLRYLFGSLIEVLHSIFSGKVFHKTVVDEKKEVLQSSILCGGIKRSYGRRL